MTTPVYQGHTSIYSQELTTRGDIIAAYSLHFPAVCFLLVAFPSDQVTLLDNFPLVDRAGDYP